MRPVLKQLRSLINELAYCAIRESGSKALGPRTYLTMMIAGPPVVALSFASGSSPILNPLRGWLSERRRRAVMSSFGVDLNYDVQYPPDLIWGDYDRNPDFLPAPGSLVIDIGANIGDYSIVAVKRFNCRAIAIEPSPSPYRLLLRNIAINKVEDSVKPLNIAVSDVDASIEMKVSEKWGYVVTSSAEGESVSVDTRKLDSFTDDDTLNKAGIVKIDVEGNEMSVLRGARKFLGAVGPRVIVEAHSDSLRQGVLSLMEGIGYRLVTEKINSPTLGISVLYFSI